MGYKNVNLTTSTTTNNQLTQQNNQLTQRVNELTRFLEDANRKIQIKENVIKSSEAENRKNLAEINRLHSETID